MAPVTQWRSKSPYIVRVQRHPVLEDHWVLELPSGATFSAPVRFDDDENPVFSLPRAELRNHIALREQKAREIDFRWCSNLSKIRFQARPLLIFPETRSLELVRSILGNKLSLENIVSIEHEVLAETGNIVRNAFLGTIAADCPRK